MGFKSNSLPPVNVVILHSQTKVLPNINQVVLRLDLKFPKLEKLLIVGGIATSQGKNMILTLFNAC